MSSAVARSNFLSLPCASDLCVERYDPTRKRAWDEFVRTGKNATFLFCRDYMDYHRDRFSDFSLMVYRGHRLLALLPANLSAAGDVISHEGLTYGGLVLRRAAALAEVLACIHAALYFLHEQGFAKLLYKRLPSFYNTVPDDDVMYAFFLLGARLQRRDCAQVIHQADRLHFRAGRRQHIQKARRAGLRVGEDTEFAPFWEQLLEPRLLKRYHARPTHTVVEITLLASRFPENIRQFSAWWRDRLVAGATIYETPTVAHAQYLAASDEGRRLGALDGLFGWLIEERYAAKQFFDFGICNENEGRALNYGLLEWKEGFGARTYSHDFYELPTESYARLDPILQVHNEGTTPPVSLQPLVLETVK